MRSCPRARPDIDAMIAKDRSPANKPAPESAGFLLCVLIAFAGNASAQSIPLRLNRAPATPAPDAAPAASAPEKNLGAVDASTDYLARMDGDRDGRVSLAEYQAWMGYAFERMDRNGDGLLTADELPGGKGRTVSLAEHRESLAAMFRRQDADRDGFLDAKELSAPPR